MFSPIPVLTSTLRALPSQAQTHAGRVSHHDQLCFPRSIVCLVMLNPRGTLGHQFMRWWGVSTLLF